MKNILKNVEKELEQPQPEQQRLIDDGYQYNPKLVLKRLTQWEIDFHCGHLKSKTKSKSKSKAATTFN